MYSEDRNGVPFGAGFECSLELADRPDIDQVLDEVAVLEIIPESYLHGRNPDFLKKLADLSLPVVGHSVDLSLGTDEPFKQKHFDQIRRVLDPLNCVIFSDHLCMTSAGGIEIGQLSTLPFTYEAADVVCRNIDTLQRQLDIPFMIENITNRFLIPSAELTETDFINLVLRRTGCGLLLDITNVYINSRNHRFDPMEWLSKIDLKRVKGIHLAGGIREGDFVYDTHSRAVHQPVWRMLEYVVAHVQPQVAIVEWDQDTPTLRRLMQEVNKAEAILDQGIQTRSAVCLQDQREVGAYL